MGVLCCLLICIHTCVHRCVYFLPLRLTAVYFMVLLPIPLCSQGELDQERLTRQQELTALYQMQHLQYQQFLIQ